MPKTALDPFFATNAEPLSSARKGAVVTPDPLNDLSNVTSSLLVTAAAAGTLTVIMANDTDQQTVIIPVAIGTWKLEIQVRRVTATSLAAGSIVAFWS